MGNIASLVGSIIQNAVHELIISILDVLLFLSILFGLTFAGWLISIVVRLVFNSAFRNCGRSRDTTSYGV